MKTDDARTAIVIGGSLGGLFTGALLERAGWTVSIHERSKADLDSRGGGIVLQPEVSRLIERVGADARSMDLGVRSRHRTVLDVDGSILSKQLAPQTQTSWSMIYTTLRRAFQGEYRRGEALVSIDAPPNAKTVSARFEDGSERTADLLVGADGGGSTVRGLLWPDAAPRYAGYLAWRGLVPEDAMPPSARAALHGDFAFASAERSHILGYLVPGDRGGTRPGERYYNFVWYRDADPETLGDIMTDIDGRPRGYSVPEGKLARKWVDHVYREAGLLLPPPFRDLVRATEAPFVQAIRDLTVDRMVRGRVALVGDAAFIPRPHTAASTSKAAANALGLADALATTRSVEDALALWEPAQIGLGDALYRRGRMIGDRLIFGS